MPKQVATLETLGNGVAMELFQHELQKVLSNMADPNTKAESKRAVTLKVTLSPFRDRSGAEVMVDCAAKLAPVPAQIAGNVFVHKEDGELTAYTSDARQADFFADPPAQPEPQQQNLVRMGGTK